MDSEKNPMGDCAAAYARLGWSVIPIESGGKKPLVRWERYSRERASEKQVQKWWQKYPGANIGIATGKVSGFIAVDIDSAKGRENYINLFGELHNTISQTTGKPNSLHLLFNPENTKISNMAGLVPDVDVRGDGGYIIIAPSVHPNGKKYEWKIDPVEMGLDDLLPLPADLKSLLTQRPAKKTKHSEDWVPEALLGVKEGLRNDMCARLAGYYLRIFSGDAEQTEAILQEWNMRNSPPLDWKEVRTVIESVAKREGRNQLGDAVGESIEKIQVLKYPPPDSSRRYRVFLVNHDGCVEMSTSELVLFSRFKIKFTELANRIPRQVKQGIWESMVNKALAEAEIINISIEETIAGFVLRIINSEVFSKGCMHDLGYVNNRIVVNDDVIYLRIETVLDMTFGGPEKITRKDIGKILRELGFVIDVIRVSGKLYRCWHRNFDNEWKDKYQV